MEYRPRIVDADPALAARLLGVDAQTLIEGTPAGPAMPRDGTLLEALFESLVTLSVRTYAQANEARVHHLRTRAGEHEIDFIVKRGDGRIVALEVELSATVSDTDTRHLRWLADTIGDERNRGASEFAVRSHPSPGHPNLDTPFHARTTAGHGPDRAVTYMSLERTTGFEPATSTLARHEQPSNPCKPQCFPGLPSGEVRPVRAVDGMLDGMATQRALCMVGLSAGEEPKRGSAAVGCVFREAGPCPLVGVQHLSPRPNSLLVLLGELTR